MVAVLEEDRVAAVPTDHQDRVLNHQGRVQEAAALGNSF